MKTILAALLISINLFANGIKTNNQKAIDSSKVTTEKQTKNISGLKIINCNSEKLGKHIYVVSDLYTQKEVSIYNQKGKKIYSAVSVGSPIYLSNFDKGIYKVRITEEGKTATRKLIIN